jgi:peptidyl-prolyl cis-trans isomerase SurA
MPRGRLAAVVALSIAAIGPATADVVNRIVATVDGDPITAHEVRRYAEERKAHGVSESDLLEAVITDKILEKEITARKIAAKKEDVDRYVNEVATKNNLTPAQFEAALKQQGMTLEQYRARVKSEIEKTQLVGQEMPRDPVEVPEEDVRRYYDAHKMDWATRTSVTVRDLFLPFRPEMTQRDVLQLVEQAKAIKRMADAGQPFDQLVRKYSQGPGAESGGLLGTFKRGEMAPPLERVAFALPVGQVSEPLVSPQGVHLLKVDAVQAEGTVPYEQVHDEIRQGLAGKAMDDRFRKWISTNLREKHHVEVLD